MNQRAKTIKELEQLGFILLRHGGKHDIYHKPGTNLTIPLKRHDFNENDAKYILKEATRKRD